MNTFFVIRFDEEGEYTADWEGVADSFPTLDEAKDFIRQNAAIHPGVKYIAAKAVLVAEAPIADVRFTEVAQ